MNLKTDFPHKYLLNLTRRQDRRIRCQEIFDDLDWDVKRQPAVDARRLGSARGFAAPGRYAHAVSTRMIFRRAALAGADAVLIFEDDVVFHPRLQEALANIELPADWGIFYLGCQQCERPEAVSPGLVRVRAALDTHAWAVRREHFLEVRRALRGKFWPKGGPMPAADILLAELCRRVPAYAAYPNLAWQQEEESDLAGGSYANYHHDGRQKNQHEGMTGLLAEAMGGKAWEPAAKIARRTTAWFWPPSMRPAPVTTAPEVEAPAPPPLTDGQRVAFLFLTRGPHWHPGVWRDYWRGLETGIAVYGHAKERNWPSDPDDWLKQSQISVHLDTEWGQLSLVKAQMALLTAALADERNRFFIFASESCVPVRPLRDLLRLLRMDGRCRFRILPHSEVIKCQPLKASRAPLPGRIPPGDWCFHSQWTLLNREAAELLVQNSKMLHCFDETHAPDEAAFGTILQAAGYPWQTRVAASDITWCRWPDGNSPHPDLITTADSLTLGDITGTGCFFARKFAAQSSAGSFGLHLPEA